MDSRGLYQYYTAALVAVSEHTHISRLVAGLYPASAAAVLGVYCH